MKDFDTTADGLPSASHRWEEQFMAGGRPQHPPADKIHDRINRLAWALSLHGEGHRAAKSWRDEITWRRKQLENLGVKEDPRVGDPQPPS